MNYIRSKTKIVVLLRLFSAGDFVLRPFQSIRSDSLFPLGGASRFVKSDRDWEVNVSVGAKAAAPAATGETG